MNCSSVRNSRGSALIATIWVMIVISGIALVMAKSMRVENTASANRLAEAQAEMTERGAEQFLCAVVDAEVTTPGTAANIGMEARQIGSGYFWVLTPNPNDQTIRSYGLTDEAGKVDLNSATQTMLQMLPGATPAMAASISGWSGKSVNPVLGGATDQDYQMLPDPYTQKGAPFETTEELLLVKDFTPDILYGSDKNHDGYLSPEELGDSGPAAAINSDNTSAAGIFPYVTAYGKLATTTARTGLVDINKATQANIRTMLTTAGISRANNILALMFPPQGQRPRYNSLLQWAALTQMSKTDFQKVVSKATLSAPTGTTLLATININTASKQALMCLPGLEESDVESLISSRQTNAQQNTPLDISWVLDVLPANSAKLRNAAQFIGNSSTCFSADIAAVSPDGRAFRRYRIVIDGSKAPAAIIYRRDMTDFGWPLDTSIRDTMRAGNPPSDANAAPGDSNTPLGQGF